MPQLGAPAVPSQSPSSAPARVSLLLWVSHRGSAPKMVPGEFKKSTLQPQPPPGRAGAVPCIMCEQSEENNTLGSTPAIVEVTLAFV